MDKRIKLLTISATCERGGSDINLLRLLKGLDKNEYEILHLIPYPGPLMDEFKNVGVQVEIVDMPRIRIFINPLRYLIVLLKFFPTVFKIKKIINEHRTDIVCTSSMVNLYAALAAKLTHRPHILIAVEYLSVLRQVSSYFYFLSEKIICCSNMVSRMFKKSDKVLVRYPGVDLDEFSPNIDGRAFKEKLGISGSLVSMVMRLARWKGVEVFIKAANYIKGDARFIIFAELVKGKERYALKLKKMIEQLGLKDKVMIREVEYKNIPYVIAASDIIVHASLRPEPFGLIIIEAMAQGKPVIASKLGGPLEIITDGIDGILIEPGNTQVLTAAISNLLGNPKKAEEIGLKAREKAAEQFNLMGYARAFDAIFKEALKEYALKCARISIGKNALLKISAPLAKLLVPVPNKYQEINKDTIKKILVIQLFGIGDLICSLPLLEALKKYFNQSKITLLIDKRFSELANLVDRRDEIMGYERGALSKFRLICDIRKNRFDLVIALNPLFQGAWISYLSRAKYRAGYIRDYERIQNIEKISCLFTHPIMPADKPMHDIQRYLDILRFLGIKTECTFPKLCIPEVATKWVDTFLQNNEVKQSDFILGINPHAGWEAKCWPMDSFVKTADYIAGNHNVKIVFLGSAARKDIERVNSIMSAMRQKSISAAGKTDIPKLAALLNRCRAFLTNDTGPMHLAAALGINMVALFGPSDVKKFGYEKENIINIAANDSFCKPCVLNYQYKNSYPDSVCMKDIEVKEVIQAIEILLRNKK